MNEVARTDGTPGSAELQAPVGFQQTVARQDASAAQALAVCLNCGATILGRYCSACGQRRDPHVHTVGHFLQEATEDLTHADSRVWQTLFALLFKPGYLTREFFAGRRSRYLPPVRLYLVVSILLFAVTTALPDDSGAFGDSLKVEVGGKPATPEFPERNCHTDFDMPGFGWLNARLAAACVKMAHGGKQQMGEAFVHNIPRMMFLFLPLIALCMKAIYWRPSRYYVEHLLFFIHNHAFVFLVAILYVLGKRMPAPVGSSIGFVAWLYVLWYCYKSMRVYYAQGHFLTACKLSVMSLVYLFLGSIMVGLTALFSFLTF